MPAQTSANTCVRVISIRVISIRAISIRVMAGPAAGAMTSDLCARSAVIKMADSFEPFPTAVLIADAPAMINASPNRGSLVTPYAFY